MGNVSACSPSCDTSSTSNLWPLNEVKIWLPWKEGLYCPPHQFPFPSIPISTFLPLPIYLILCHSCELNWLILILSLEQCQSWQQAAKMHGEEKWEEEWVKKVNFTFLPEINLINSQKAGQGTKVLKARVPMKVADCAVPVSAEDAAVWGAPRLLVWLYTASSQHENKELTIIHLHALGSSSTF